MKRVFLIGVVLLALAGGAWAEDGHGRRGCSLSNSVVNSVLSQLSSVVQLNNGGLFSPNKMWAAVVERKGVLCGVVRSDPDAWPGSRDIAIAKTNTVHWVSKIWARGRNCTARRDRQCCRRRFETAWRANS